MKQWWSEELMDRHREVQRLAQQVYKKRVHPQDPIHRIHKVKRNIYIWQCDQVHQKGTLGGLPLVPG